MSLPRSKTKVLKACPCGREFSRIDWKKLPLVGRQGDDVETRELRNCPCGSTISVGRPKTFVFYDVERSKGGWLIFRRAAIEEVVLRGDDVGALHLDERKVAATLTRERRLDRQAAKRLGVALVTSTKGAK